MEKKISAKELWDVVADTNAKVSEMASGRTTGSAEKKAVSKIGTAADVILMIIGALLIATIFVPQVLTMLHLEVITASTIKWMYFGYALVAVVIAAITRVNVPVRLLTVLVGIAPMAITLILSLI